jgi:DNA-binding CsgD family transcriptional regulator/tetratricopeptide (TPR) repeat protein
MSRHETSAQRRESLRARIGVALWLAIDYDSARAFDALAEIRPAVSSRDQEITALYFHAYAVACVKARRITEGFEAFERALAAARLCGDAALCGKILNNYGTAAAQAGSASVAVARLEEALGVHRALGGPVSLGLISLAEALYAAGDLTPAASLLHEIHTTGVGRVATMHADDPTMLLAVAAVGIPVGLALPDEALLKLSSDPQLIDIAFTRREQYLVGPLVEAFCLLYEHQGNREEHDALLTRALDSASSLDNSLQLGIRAGRLGSAHHLARTSTLISRQCPKASASLRAHKDLFDSFISARRRMTDRARELGLRAAREFARAGRPLQEALAHVAAGNREEAVALCERCGAKGTALLPCWTGAPIPKRMTRQLTPRESEVARLAANGSSNRAIATVLGLSERTVQNHCEAIFIKLGIRSRWQISAEIGRAAEARLDA